MIWLYTYLQHIPHLHIDDVYIVLLQSTVIMIYIYMYNIYSIYIYMYNIYIHIIVYIYDPVLRPRGPPPPPNGMGPQVAPPLPFYLQAIGSISEVQPRIY